MRLCRVNGIWRIHAIRDGRLDPVERRKNRHKSCVLAEAEHPFVVLKVTF
jgi:hypothetical protein